jgi:hypothetical protein
VIQTDIIPDRALLDSLRATLGEVLAFAGIAEAVIDNWPMCNSVLSDLDIWRTDARNALDALGGPISRTQYGRATEAGE